MKATMSVAAEPPVSEVTAPSAAACVFRSLGDPARLAILRDLALGEHEVVDLTAHLGWPGPPSPRTWPACATAAWCPPGPGRWPSSAPA